MGIEDRLFDDDTRHLDSFGWLLLLVAASVTINSLIDFDDPTLDVKSEIMWVLGSVIVGGTVQLAIRSSGAARRPRTFASIIIWVFVGGAVLVSLFGDSAEYAVGTASAARPSIFWVLLGFAAPLFVVRRLFRQESVDRETLMGALAAFLLIALAFHYAFLATVSWNGEFFGTPESSSSFMYFSLVTITTLGYGDLQPVSNVARYLSSAEAVIGQIFLVVVVARLVSMYGTKNQHGGTTAGEERNGPA